MAIAPSIDLLDLSNIATAISAALHEAAPSQEVLTEAFHALTPIQRDAVQAYHMMLGVNALFAATAQALGAPEDKVKPFFDILRETGVSISMTKITNPTEEDSNDRTVARVSRRRPVA